jgi:hypothetical protein
MTLIVPEFLHHFLGFGNFNTCKKLSGKIYLLSTKKIIIKTTFFLINIIIKFFSLCAMD